MQISSRNGAQGAECNINTQLSADTPVSFCAVLCCPAEELAERLARVDVIKESMAARQAQRPAPRQVIRTGIYQKGSDDEDSDFE